MLDDNTEAQLKAWILDIEAEASNLHIHVYFIHTKHMAISIALWIVFIKIWDFFRANYISFKYWSINILLQLTIQS